MSYPIETLLPFSIENFLSEDEVGRILDLMDAYKSANPERLQAGAKGLSVHRDPALSIEEIVAHFEPRGRLDINTVDLPAEVIDIAESAYYRRIEDIRRHYPSALGPGGLTYVEYGPGQYFTAHIDGAAWLQVGGFGVTLTSDFEGGEFCVETCGSGRMWMVEANGETSLAPFASHRSEWYRNLPRTQWTTRPKKGDAIFYGSSLTHGMKPVTEGVLKKLIAFIVRAPAPDLPPGAS